jgi:hypothetical protein
MSFSHLEKNLLIMRTKQQWSVAVRAAVQTRYDRHHRPELTAEPEPEHHMRNFVFIANFDPGYTNTTVFVSFFKLTELEYCLLHDLGDMRPPTEAEKTRLKSEYLGHVYALSSEAKQFLRARVALFGVSDFSRTTVLDMKSLVHDSSRAYFVFYRKYYLQALHMCGRSEARELHEAMDRLGDRLLEEARAAEARAVRPAPTDTIPPAPRRASAQPTEPCKPRHPGETKP